MRIIRGAPDRSWAMLRRGSGAALSTADRLRDEDHWGAALPEFGRDVQAVPEAVGCTVGGVAVTAGALWRSVQRSLTAPAPPGVAATAVRWTSVTSLGGGLSVSSVSAMTSSDNLGSSSVTSSRLTLSGVAATRVSPSAHSLGTKSLGAMARLYTRFAFGSNLARHRWTFVSRPRGF
jgi:hypothetical protein